MFAYKEIKGCTAESISSMSNEEIERELLLLGVTGVVDKLQD